MGQAILCRLEGAEELAASEAGAELVRRRLPGEVLVAAPGARADPADPAVAVVLYDTSTQRDLNLNKEIVHDFCMQGAFTITQVTRSPTRADLLITKGAFTSVIYLQHKSAKPFNGASEVPTAT